MSSPSPPEEPEPEFPESLSLFPPPEDAPLSGALPEPPELPDDPPEGIFVSELPPEVFPPPTLPPESVPVDGVPAVPPDGFERPFPPEGVVFSAGAPPPEDELLSADEPPPEDEPPLAALLPVDVFPSAGVLPADVPDAGCCVEVSAPGCVSAGVAVPAAFCPDTVFPLPA